MVFNDMFTKCFQNSNLATYVPTYFYIGTYYLLTYVELGLYHWKISNICTYIRNKALQMSFV